MKYLMLMLAIMSMAGVCPTRNARKCEHGGSTALPDTLNTGMVLHAINLGEFFFKE